MRAFALNFHVFVQLGAILSEWLEIPPMTAGLTVLCTGLALYDPICRRIGGDSASFSPAVNFALAGAGKGSLKQHALRSVCPHPPDLLPNTLGTNRYLDVLVLRQLLTASD